MNLKKRLERAEAEAILRELMEARSRAEVDELTRMFRAVGPKELGRILKKIDRQTRSLPIEREQQNRFVSAAVDGEMTCEAILIIEIEPWRDGHRGGHMPHITGEREGFSEAHWIDYP